jgi:hypothetical protein
MDQRKSVWGSTCICTADSHDSVLVAACGSAIACGDGYKCVDVEAEGPVETCLEECVFLLLAQINPCLLCFGALQAIAAAATCVST